MGAVVEAFEVLVGAGLLAADGSLAGRGYSLYEMGGAEESVVQWLDVGLRVARHLPKSESSQRVEHLDFVEHGPNLGKMVRYCCVDSLDYRLGGERTQGIETADGALDVASKSR